MTDPFAEVSPGQPIEIAAKTWNGLLKSAQAYHRTRLGGSNNSPGPDALDYTINPASIILVKNTTEDDLPQYSVQAYAGVVIDPGTTQMGPPSVQRRPTFNGATPESDGDQVCITIEPILAGQFGRAVCSGVAIVQLMVCPDYLNWAVPVADETGYLETVSHGGYPVLAVGSSAGGGSGSESLHWGLVLMGPTMGPAVDRCQSSSSNNNPSESSSSGVEVVTDVNCGGSSSGGTNQGGGLNVTFKDLTGSVTIGGKTYPVTFTLGAQQ